MSLGEVGEGKTPPFAADINRQELIRALKTPGMSPAMRVEADGTGTLFCYFDEDADKSVIRTIDKILQRQPGAGTQPSFLHTAPRSEWSRYRNVGITALWEEDVEFLRPVLESINVPIEIIAPKPKWGEGLRNMITSFAVAGRPKQKMKVNNAPDIQEQYPQLSQGIIERALQNLANNQSLAR